MVANESTDELQARLRLERQTAGVFRLFFQHAPTLVGLEFTILAFDHGDSGHVAYKTSLPIEYLIRTFERLIGAWDGGPPIYAPPGIEPYSLKLLGGAIKKALPAGTGFAVVVGALDRIAYMSASERADVRLMIETELLPNWRKEAVG
jgi:hypothetical protein